jgi:hypothetical protein
MSEDEIARLTAKILKLSRQLFSAAEQLDALAKTTPVRVPHSIHLLAAKAAIAAVLRSDDTETQPATGAN